MNKQVRKSLAGGLRAMVFVAFYAALAAAPAQAATADGATTTRMHAATTSFNFHDIPVRSALQLIAEEADLNLVVSDSVTGNITLHLDDVTWEQALDVVLKLKGLQMRVDRGARTLAVGD